MELKLKQNDAGTPVYPFLRFAALFCKEACLFLGDPETSFDTGANSQASARVRLRRADGRACRCVHGVCDARGGRRVAAVSGEGVAFLPPMYSTNVQDAFMSAKSAASTAAGENARHTREEKKKQMIVYIRSRSHFNQSVWL